MLEALRFLLKSEGFDARTVGAPAAVMAAIQEDEFDVALIDLNYARDTTSGGEGLDLLTQMQAAAPSLPVVVMTAWASVDGAVEAMRRGARDYLEKPWNNERLVTVLRTQIALAKAQQSNRRYQAETQRQRESQLPLFIAESAVMEPVLRLMKRVGPSDASVLITGEHGTGKEVVARWLHAASLRASGPFIAVNAGGLPDGVFESELFGHVRGAFTDAKTDRAGCFELAERGTIFLDEIGNMPPGQQAKLLRVLQTGEFHAVGSSRVRRADVRVLAATNTDLGKAAAEGRFREDLLYRLNTVEIPLPPLRERREDILPLAMHALGRQCARYQRQLDGFSPAAQQPMLAHAWPGNVRELEHVVERAVLLCEGTHIEARDLALVAAQAGSSVEEMTLEDAERALIEKALARCAGNVAEAAKRLGLSRSALYRRLAAFGIRVSE